MERLLELAGRHDLVVVEDAAQAHGARRHGRAAGSFGLASGFSFYPGKNLGAYGDAGAVITHDADVYDAVRRLRNWGSDRKYHHPVMGFNSRLGTLQAVVLLAKLQHLAAGNQHRREVAALYDELLADMPEVSRPSVLDGNEPVWHLYVVRVAQRDRVLQHLNENGIGAGIHYPIPIHLQGAYADLGKGPGSFPVAERAADEILSLPMFTGITEIQQEHTVEVLRQALGRSGRLSAAG
jgi:dTDP-4-amino-4,6-dideoxygalactose transaminase